MLRPGSSHCPSMCVCIYMHTYTQTYREVVCRAETWLVTLPRYVCVYIYMHTYTQTDRGAVCCAETWLVTLPCYV